MKFRKELVDKINIFNQIFELDFINSSDNEKNWKYYLDNISKHLFNKSYISFIKDNSLELNAIPGSFEKYYNLFKAIINDFKGMTSLPVPHQIYLAADDILKSFNEFLVVNNYHVKEVNRQDNYQNLNYEICPTI